MRAHEFIELDEIVNPVEREVQVSEPFTKVAYDTAFGQSGGGAYADAKPDSKDPHMYRKELYGPSNLDKDAYYQYIKAASPYMGENPYFPRVYVIKLEKDINGLIRPIYKMEKLYPGTLLDKSARGRALIKSILNRSFGPNIVTDEEVRWWVVTDMLEDMLRFNLESYPDADPALIEAINLIKKVYKSDSDFDYDMHAGNAMYRLTSTGPQLVITDPLYERNFNSKVFEGSEFLAELADQPYPFDIATNRASESRFGFTTETGDEYLVIIYLQQSGKSFQPDQLRVDFAQRIAGTGGYTDKQTGAAGSASLRIFSTVFAALKTALEFRLKAGLPINTIIFSGRNTEPSRIALYRRFARSIGRYLPGWRFQSESPAINTIEFTVVRTQKPKESQ